MDSCTPGHYPSHPSPALGRRLGICCILVTLQYIPFFKIMLVLILTLHSAQQGMTTTDTSYLPNNTNTAWNWCSCTAVKDHCCLPWRSASWRNTFSQLIVWFLEKVKINSLQWGQMMVQTYPVTSKHRMAHCAIWSLNLIQKINSNMSSWPFSPMFSYRRNGSCGNN